MKVKYKGIEIECTPEEFEDLCVRGIFDTPQEALRDFLKEEPINRPKKNPYDPLPPRIDPPGMVMAYGVQQYPGGDISIKFPEAIALYGCTVESSSINTQLSNISWPPKDDTTGNNSEDNQTKTNHT